MTTTKILENCLCELLQKAKDCIIYFPNRDTLQMMDLPDSNIRKNPKPRFIQCVTQEGPFIQVRVVTPASNGREKAKIHTYNIGNFDDQTKGRILQLAIRHIQ